jgi:hypothetical protein
MQDFRYHALTLIAVFVALAIGLLLGVSVGDKGLVSSANRSLRKDLENRVQSARAEARDLRAELGDRNAYEEQTLGPLVSERLTGRRISVIFVHEDRRDAIDPIRAAVRAAGGEIGTVTSLREPLNFEALAAAAVGTRYEAMGADDAELRNAFARRMGEQFVQPGGGKLLNETRRELLASSSGAFDGAEGVVVVRGEPDQDAPEEDFVVAFVEGMRALRTPVVGVELLSTDPSQIRWYESRDLASVDNVDEPSGMASLVYALAGSADGAYGRKGTADAIIPEALTARG